MVTELWDLSRFGYREIDLAIELLKAYKNTENTELDVGEEIQICFNSSSGYVFLTNSEYEVFMVNDETGKLEEWFNCGSCGFEGFKEDVKDIKNHMTTSASTTELKECKEWIKEREF